MPQGDAATVGGKLRRSLAIPFAVTVVLAVANLLLPVPYAVVIALAALLVLTVATLLVVVFLDSLNLPFGVAPALVVLLGAVATVWLAVARLTAREPETAKGTKLTLWTFADIHARAYDKAAPSFEKKHPDVDVDVQLMVNVAVTSRLRAAFWADLDVPDLVEVEISSAGTFFRGRVEDLGFIDWTPWLKETGLYGRIVKTRFAPYTWKDKATGQERIFGLPHDVHPVMLAYNRVAFEELGIDAAKLATWDDFIREGRRVTKKGKRYMIQLSDSNASGFEVLLFQRDGGYFDVDGNLTMDNEIAVEAMTWYIPLVAGKRLIGNDIGGREIFTKAVEEGVILSFICPDWRSKGTETHVGSMHGKMALMPLPAVRPGGRRTSTWGGTMLGITRKCPNKALAYQLAEHLYLDTRDLAARFRELNILPPLKDAWALPEFNEPRAYWSGQPIGKLYAELAEQVPPQYTSPYIGLAKGKMGEVVSASAAYYGKHRDDGFDAFVRARLKAAADYVRKQMRRNPF